MLNETRASSELAGHRVPATQDKVACYLMFALAVATIGAFANALFEFGTLSPDRLVVGTWQMLGFVVFAGLFALLAIWPRRMPGLWELVLFHKIAVTLINAGLIGTATGPMPSDDPLSVVIVDGALVAMTLLCYLLSRGWQVWFVMRSKQLDSLRDDLKPLN